MPFIYQRFWELTKYTGWSSYGSLENEMSGTEKRTCTFVVFEIWYSKVTLFSQLSFSVLDTKAFKYCCHCAPFLLYTNLFNTPTMYFPEFLWKTRYLWIYTKSSNLHLWTVQRHCVRAPYSYVELFECSNVAFQQTTFHLLSIFLSDHYFLYQYNPHRPFYHIPYNYSPKMQSYGPMRQ